MDSAPETTRFGYLGLGDMGRGMAMNLAKSGLPLKVYDLNPRAMEPVVEAGAQAASDLGDLVQFADIIHMCLVYDEDVKRVITGPDGILDLGHPGQIIVVHGTMSPTTLLGCAEAAREHSIEIVDCPVSGHRERSIEGTLTLMAGGDDAVIGRCRPALDAMGTVHHIGPVGAGQAAKLANNVMTHCNRLAYLEGLQIAEAFGISEESLNEIVTQSTGMSYSQVHHDRGDRHGISHTLAGTDELPVRFSKDMRSATKVALDLKLSMPLTALATQVMPQVYTARWERVLSRAGEDLTQREI